MNKAYRLILPIFGIWLIGWIIASWAAIQDDALIHLRYADYILRTHFITYDGIHASYGTSSLLYVHLLAFLRFFTLSPNLPRAVSSCLHLALAFGLGFVFVKLVPRKSSLARLLGLVLLLIIVSPSSVRWLDDGMETGFSLCFVALLCVLTFRQSNRSRTTVLDYSALTAVAFFTVLLRTELALLCGIAFLMLVWKDLARNDISWTQRLRAAFRSTHLALGCLLAMAYIFWKMHSLLPDTAIAKATGPSWQDFYVAGVVITGAMTFGAGCLLFWLLSLFLVLRARLFSVPTLFANAVFPLLLVLSAARGQQLQGARYLVWAYFFSLLWNILELSRIAPDCQITKSSRRLIYSYIVLLLIVLPLESMMMYRILSRRAATMRQFEGQRLGILHDKRGTAFDIGYIGYFSKAEICDLAGLVNGRSAARLSNDQRYTACAATHPDFVFGSLGELEYLKHFMPLDDWLVCSGYDFVNVRTLDTHYLLFPPSTALGLCKAISGAAPYSVDKLRGWKE